MKKADYVNTIIKICIFLSIITCSFDIFANVIIAGLNFRFCQFVLLPVMIFLLYSIIRSRKIKGFLGMEYLLIWLAFQIIFVFRSPDLSNAVAYVLWLIFNIWTVYLIYYYTDVAFTIEELMVIYLNSFFFMAVLGIIQMFLFFCNINLYVTQYWNKYLCRINGFTYEPSYYATYMLMGFVMYAYLLEKGNENIMKQKVLAIKFVFVAVAIVLSSSRMGWLMMVVWLYIRGINLLMHFVKKRKGGWSYKQVVLLVSIILFILLSLYAIWIKLFKNGPLSFLLSGMGVYGKPAHSVKSRISGLLQTLEIFMENPFLGVSLGGVDPAVVQRNGMVYNNSLNGCAMSIIGELLVSSGIIGLIPFMLYIGKLIKGTKWWRKDFDLCRLANVYRAVEWALIFELLILCFNQNILRVYVWIHIGILCALYKRTDIENYDNVDLKENTVLETDKA